MGIPKNKKPSTAQLRRRAEERLNLLAKEKRPPRTGEETQRLLHELQVHQIELEMQNEELGQAREAQEISLNKFSELYDFSPVGYFTIDAHGLIEEVNLKGAHLLGIERRLLLKRPFANFIAEAADRKIFSRHIEEVFQKRGNRTCDIRLKRKYGTTFYAQLQSMAKEDIQRKAGAILTVIIDITEHKEAEAKIEHLASFPQLNPNPVIETDLKGQVIFYNAATIGVFKKLDALNTKDDVRLFLPRDLTEIIKTLKQGNEGEYITREVEVNGRVFTENIIHHAHMNVVRLYAQDITERRRAEHHQSLSTEILGIVNDALPLTDTINGILTTIKRETGFDAVGIRLQHGDDFPYFVQEGFSQDFLLMENTLIAREASGGVCRDKNGNISLECTCGVVISGQTDPTNPLFTQGGSFWINDSLPLLDLPVNQDPRLNPRNRCIHDGFCSVALIPIRANQEIVGLLQLNDRKKGCFTPEMITFFEGLASSIGIALTRKGSEEAIKERTSQLEAANKELESFSYSVSHDLRAPLRAIDGYSRMILRQQGDTFDENTKHQFDVIRQNAKMMGQLIDDLLAFSHMGKKAISLSRLNIGDLTGEVWEELKAINPDRPVDFKIVHLPPGMGDRSLIKQVLINILANAIKFTRIREAPLVEVGGYGTESENVYYIRDNGVGFDMQYHDKLFGVFQRLHSADDYQGTGVGLAIVQRIIHRHGGRVWAESEIDKGATFYFTLPVAQE